jgi:hypothetical protein
MLAFSGQHWKANNPFATLIENVPKQDSLTDKTIHYRISNENGIEQKGNMS